MEISKHKTGPGERRRRSRLHQVKQSASLSQNTTELTQNQDLFSGPAFNIRRKPRMGSRVKRIGLECLKISSAHMPSAFAARVNASFFFLFLCCHYYLKGKCYLYPGSTFRCILFSQEEWLHGNKKKFVIPHEESVHRSVSPVYV